MNWLLKTLLGAVVAGLGWRFGADAYESIKKRISGSEEKQDEKKAENGAGVTQTGSASSESGGGERPSSFHHQ